MKWQAAKKLGLKRGDWMLAAALVLLAVAALLLLRPATPQQGQVVVSQDGVEVLRVALSTDATYPIGDALTLHVQDAAAWVQDAHCPDKLCEHMGRISTEGPTIACLPNRVLVRIEAVAGDYDVKIGEAGGYSA